MTHTSFTLITLITLILIIPSPAHSQTNSPTTVHINPESIAISLPQTQTPEDINLSALTYDSQGNPIHENIIYSWSMSSTGSLGFLEAHDKIATFTPREAGWGSLNVTASNGTFNATGSIPVTIFQWADFNQNGIVDLEDHHSLVTFFQGSLATTERNPGYDIHDFNYLVKDFGSDTGYHPSLRHTDPVTQEFYDLHITADISTEENLGSGPALAARTTLYAHGTYIDHLDRLIAIYQDGRGVEFTASNDASYPRFTSEEISLTQNGCFDLYEGIGQVASAYLATFCQRTHIAYPDNHYTAYAPDPRLFLEYDYNGSQPASLLTLSTAFDRRELNPLSELPETNLLGHRYQYLTIDTNTSSLSDFNNVNYNLTAITDPQDRNPEYCGTSPQKYLNQTFQAGTPGGGYYQTAQVNYCSFSHETNRLLPFFLSLSL